MINFKEIVDYYQNKGIKQFSKTAFFSCFNPIYMNTKFGIKNVLTPNAVVINASIPCKNNRFARLDNLNWGDDINMILPSLISGRSLIPYNYSPLAKFGLKDNVICIGSVLTWLTNRNSIIWGAGVIDPTRPLPAKPKKVLAVRGPLTLEYLRDKGVDCPNVFGDPALLLPQFYKPNVKKKFEVGIIPHLTQQNLPIVNKFKSDPNVKIIDIVNYGNWSDFIDEVLSCKSIVSSSLHGLILSDTYHVPNRWISFSEMDNIQRFKYKDYYMSVGKEIEYPFVVNENTTKDSLIKHTKKWVPNNLDLQPLISSCPF